MNGETLAAYLATRYRVFTEPAIDLRIGERSDAMVALLARHHVESAVFVTAFNPFSRPERRHERNAPTGAGRASRAPRTRDDRGRRHRSHGPLARRGKPARARREPGSRRCPDGGIRAERGRVRRSRRLRAVAHASGAAHTARRGRSDAGPASPLTPEDSGMGKRDRCMLVRAPRVYKNIDTMTRPTAAPVSDDADASQRPPAPGTSMRRTRYTAPSCRRSRTARSSCSTSTGGCAPGTPARRGSRAMRRPRSSASIFRASTRRRPWRAAGRTTNCARRSLPAVSRTKAGACARTARSSGRTS